MEKMYQVLVKSTKYYNNWRGKEKCWSSGTECPLFIMAESEGEAKEKALAEWKEIYEEQFSRIELEIRKINSWDSWTVSQAMKLLNGKQFKEWAKQQDILNLCPMIERI